MFTPSKTKIAPYYRKSPTKKLYAYPQIFSMFTFISGLDYLPLYW